MLRAFLRSEAWRQYIYGMMYPEADEAYEEFEEEEIDKDLEAHLKELEEEDQP
jgi:hypothetical protein